MKDSFAKNRCEFPLDGTILCIESEGVKRAGSKWRLSDGWRRRESAGQQQFILMIVRVCSYIVAMLTVVASAHAQSTQLKANAAHDACLAHVLKQPNANADVARLAHGVKERRGAVTYEFSGVDLTPRGTVFVEFAKTGKKCLIVYQFQHDREKATWIWGKHLNYMLKSDFTETESRKFNGGNWHFYQKDSQRISMMGYANLLYGNTTHLVVTYKRKR